MPSLNVHFAEGVGGGGAGGVHVELLADESLEANLGGGGGGGAEDTCFGPGTDPASNGGGETDTLVSSCDELEQPVARGVAGRADGTTSVSGCDELKKAAAENGGGGGGGAKDKF